jgi:hypothetical protein
MPDSATDFRNRKAQSIQGAAGVVKIMNYAPSDADRLVGACPPSIVFMMGRPTVTGQNQANGACANLPPKGV